MINIIKNKAVEINISGSHGLFWSYKDISSGNVTEITGPVFEIDGKIKEINLTDIKTVCKPVILTNGVTEYRYEGILTCDGKMSFELIFRIADDNPVARFRYILKSESEYFMTKSESRDMLTYMGIDAADFTEMKEVRFSEFYEMTHSYHLTEYSVDCSAFENESSVMGPVIFGKNGDYYTLLAYEHGSQIPDAYIEYRFNKNHKILMNAVKANYLRNQKLNKDNPYKTVWMEICGIRGDENRLAEIYREFILKYMSINTESRKPYVCYNTWAFCERNKFWHKKDYWTDTTNIRILEEIAYAHRLGVDIFVLDGGWSQEVYGDWRINYDKFPNGLGELKTKLDSYGMRFGIWFGPSYMVPGIEAHKENIGCEAKVNGEYVQYRSGFMCLVSRYKEEFIKMLFKMIREEGVTYFKFDGVGQYDCDEPGHGHGDENHTNEERYERFAFMMPETLNYIADTVTKEYPDVIIEFDITESGRSVGLSYLASGKYFIVNNGPYYSNYNIPIPADMYNNIFVYPGEARAMICRDILGYDKWLPSSLFLTHYLPDDPIESQTINTISLMLGQNGIWGDLPGISESGIDLMAGLLEKYKKVRDDITESFPVRTGNVGGSPEIHEKISAKTGAGMIAIFSSVVFKAKYSYITKNKPAKKYWRSEGVSVNYLKDGTAVADISFDKPGAKVIFFGDF